MIYDIVYFAAALAINFAARLSIWRGYSLLRSLHLL